MTNDSHGAALAAVVGSWGAWVASFLTKALPFFQITSLIAATVASICAAIYYRRRSK